MAGHFQDPGGGRDDIKTQFITREGVYRLMTHAEYSKPQRPPGTAVEPKPVKVTFVDLPHDPDVDDIYQAPRICFNIGRELFFYPYYGHRKAADLCLPLDKRTYKGTVPSCHDCNQLTASVDGMMVLIGFSAGQIQLIEPIRKEISKIYNEERYIDKSKVTCIKWLPGSRHQFLAAHVSGQMYVYNDDLSCGQVEPAYQLFKNGEGFSVYTCKTKTSRNPMFRWVIGEGAINEFAFSPDGQHLAVVSQDGFLRVFLWETMDLIGGMRSYFGGLLCVSWSPDGKYVATGGEDDLVCVWSLADKCVVCRCNGHVSWVSSVAFDDINCILPDSMSNGIDTSEGEEHPRDIINYRLGSVGQDTNLCLWDLSDDVLRPSSRSSQIASLPLDSVRNFSFGSISQSHDSSSQASMPENSSSSSFSNRFATLALGEKHKERKHERNFSLGSKSGEKVSFLRSNNIRPSTIDASKLLGTTACPRLNDVPVVEAILVKKISNERLSSLHFREESIVTACFDGFVYTWSRPERHSYASNGGTIV